MNHSESIPRGPAIVIVVATVLLLVDDLVPGRVPYNADEASLVAIIGIGLAAVMLFVRPRTLWKRLAAAAPGLAAGAAVSLVVTAVLLVASEFATRWVFRDVTTTSDDRGYFSARWSKDAVQFNTHGFRERPFDGKGPGTYRIAVMGDSFTFGNGIPAEARYSSLLQHALGDGFEVLNFGMPGFNTPEVAWLLSDRVRGFDPDFVLVQWFVNDVEGSGKARPRYQPLLPFPAVHEALHRGSALYTLASTWWTRRQVGGLTAGSYADYMQRTFGDPHSPGALDDRRALRAVLKAAGGLPIGFVLFPDVSYDLGEGYPFGFLHDRMMAFCAENLIPCVDLRPEFARVENRRALWANRLDAHPSARANAIAADRIRQTFEPLWLTRVH